MRIQATISPLISHCHHRGLCQSVPHLLKARYQRRHAKPLAQSGGVGSRAAIRSGSSKPESEGEGGGAEGEDAMDVDKQDGDAFDKPKTVEDLFMKKPKFPASTQ